MYVYTLLQIYFQLLWINFLLQRYQIHFFHYIHLDPHLRVLHWHFFWEQKCLSKTQHSNTQPSKSASGKSAISSWNHRCASLNSLNFPHSMPTFFPPRSVLAIQCKPFLWELWFVALQWRWIAGSEKQQAYNRTKGLVEPLATSVFPRECLMKTISKVLQWSDYAQLGSDLFDTGSTRLK